MIDNYDLINERFNRLNDKFDKEVLQTSFMNYVNFSSEVKGNERKKWREGVKNWMNKINFEKIMFPRCILNVKQLLVLASKLNCKFPLKLYSRGDLIKVVNKEISGKEGEYEKIKAYDCLVEVLRVDGLFGFNVPLVVEMRLVYLPARGKGLEISYTGKGFERIIKQVNEINYDDEGRMKFIEMIKFIPFELIKLICEDAELNNKEYVRTWCRTLIFNITGNDL